MTFGGDVLTGVLGNAAWDIVKNLALKILGPGKDTYEQDDMVNRAYFALEDASKRFFINTANPSARNTTVSWHGKPISKPCCAGFAWTARK